jgi:hypothetical protein
MMQIQFLNQIRDVVHALAKEKGFYDPAPSVAAHCANLTSEVSELWEAFCKGKLREPCDKAEHMSEPLTCEEEEIADIIIRALDYAAHRGIDVDRAVSVKHAFNQTRSYRHGGKAA